VCVCVLTLHVTSTVLMKSVLCILLSSVKAFSVGRFLHVCMADT